MDIRADCFRGLLKVAPRAALQGLIDYLMEFSIYAGKITEACSVAKALVRSMTDVIEVLGNTPGGLLLDPSFVRQHSTGDMPLQKMLPELWKGMTSCIAVIFRRTPKWAIYYDNKVMVEWMRDGLIFGRDLLERRKSFEVASLPLAQQDGQSPRKSSIGHAMIGNLQDVLFEVQAWLRLTDMELLYQSFALLKSLFQCFHKSKVKPSEDALGKLRKFIDTERSTTQDGRTGIVRRKNTPCYLTKQIL